MAAKKVAFKRLMLRGFGLYRDGIEVFFEPGINNLVTENERGKSTLVAGLIALLYGLPAKSNPAEFGLACYRNWDNPSRCEGELEFAVNDEHFILARDFDTNRILLCKICKIGPEGKTILAEGIHNPMARRAHPEYENKLKEILGINSRDLFESVFCILQPFPEMKTLSNEVQKLLSGGGLDFRMVLASLEEELKTHTRYTGELGITSRNLHKDKELEIVQAEIALLRRRIEEDRQAVDSLEELQRELGEIDLKLQKVRQEQQNKRKILEAWGEWKRRRDNYDSAFREYKTLSESCKEAEKIREEINLRLGFLQEEYAEFEGAAEETAKNLEELALLEEKKKEFEKSLDELKRVLLENLKEKEKLNTELQNFPRWQELGGDPLGRVKDTQKNAAALKKEWSIFQADLDNLKKKQHLLERKYSLFQKACPDELEAVKTYSRKLGELLQGREKAKVNLENARAKRENYEKNLSAFKEKFRDFETDIPAEETVIQKLGALEEKHNYAQKVAHLKKKLLPSLRLRLIFASVFALFGAVAGALAGSPSTFILVAAGVITGSLGGYFVAGPVCYMLNSGVKKELKETEQNLSVCREKISSLNGRLGRFADATPAQLGSLLEKIKQYKEEKTKLEEMRKEMPADEEINALEKECRKSEDDYREFSNLTSKFASLFPDVEEAYANWQKLLEEREYLAAKTEAYARDSFGCEAEKIFAVNPLALESGGLWKEVAFFLQILFPERELTTVERVIALLDSTGSQTWEQLEEKARKYDSIVKRIRKFEDAIDMLESNKREQNNRLLTLQEKIETYYRTLSAILSKAGGDVRKARERWAARQAVLQEIDIKKSKLQTILSQFQVDTQEKLKDKELEGQIILKKRLEEWENLMEKYPGLPGVEESRDVEKIAARLQSLEGEAEQIEKQLQELQRKQEDVRTRLLLLQRQDPVNIAQAEIELNALVEKKRDLELIRDALVRAHRELSAAIVDYQNSYQQHLQQVASDYYQKITGNLTRKIILDQDFQVQVEEEGRPCEIVQLSKGAQDQLYLALRLAIADLISDNIKLPFIFDDPFVSSDSERLENIREILNNTAQQRQYAIFSHNPIFSGWGAPVKIMSGKKEPRRRLLHSKEKEIL